MEAVGHNYRCVSGDAVASGEVIIIRGRRFRWICLISDQGEKRLHEGVCPPELRGGRTLAEAEVEAKRAVVANCEGVKQREDKLYNMKLTPLLLMRA